MTNSKQTKRALLSSAMALVLCFAMLLGTTFAWFTDNASTSVNKIQAGTLDVALEMKDANGNWVSAEGKTLNFKTADDRTDNILWEPGCTYELPELRILNTGNLAFKFKLIVTGIVGDAKLNEVIDWEILSGIPSGDSIGWGSENDWMDLDGAVDDDEGLYLVPANNGDSENVSAVHLKLKGHMKETANNSYQGLSIDGIAITVVATQYTYENDSNGNEYDANATYEIPEMTTPVSFADYANQTEFVLNTADDLKAFAKEVNENGKGFEGKTVKLGKDIDLNNTEWTPIGQTDGGGTQNRFYGTFDGQNHTIKNLAVSASTYDESANYAAGLFGFSEGLTIKNLTIDGARLAGHHWTGAVVGYASGNSTIENCHVKNAHLSSTHANDEACGDKVGAVIGQMGAGSVTVKDCTAKNCTVSAGRDAGQVVGAGYANKTSNCSATEVTVKSNETCTGANVRNEVIGRELK